MQWISVRDCLPDELDEVLVRDPVAQIVRLTEFHSDKFWIQRDWESDEELSEEEVSHWMRLPTRYSGSSTETTIQLSEKMQKQMQHEFDKRERIIKDLLEASVDIIRKYHSKDD